MTCESASHSRTRFAASTMPNESPVHPCGVLPQPGCMPDASWQEWPATSSDSWYRKRAISSSFERTPGRCPTTPKGRIRLVFLRAPGRSTTSSPRRTTSRPCVPTSPRNARRPGVDQPVRRRSFESRPVTAASPANCTLRGECRPSRCRRFATKARRPIDAFIRKILPGHRRPRDRGRQASPRQPRPLRQRPGTRPCISRRAAPCFRPGTRSSRPERSVRASGHYGRAIRSSRIAARAGGRRCRRGCRTSRVEPTDRRGPRPPDPESSVRSTRANPDDRASAGGSPSVRRRRGPRPGARRRCRQSWRSPIPGLPPTR